MKTFVLIHGACHGGWAWDKLAPKLQNAGYAVYAPTLIGMGDRADLLSSKITMQQHVDEIVQLISGENLHEVILVGHSYAGLIIAAVNEAVPERISQLVFLDSYIPEDGKTGMEIIGQEYQESWQHVADKYGKGWVMPTDERSIDVWGVTDPEVRAYLLPKITDFSLNFMKTRIFLTFHFDNVKKTYIRCTKPSYCYQLMYPFFERAEQAEWPIYKIDSDHEPMLTATDELAEILLQIAKN